MAGPRTHDQGRPRDWSCTSEDYAKHRPGYPPSFYHRLTALGIGLPGQHILDLGTGTGNIARALAAIGCQVTGIDISAQQIEQAQRLASEGGLDVNWLVGPAEDTGIRSASFDAITAAQCWHYFDRDQAVAEVKRLLDGGRLMTCHLCWLPREDPIARRTEELVLRYNPQWSAADLTDDVSPTPDWIGNDFSVTGFFVYREAIPFTRESWRGRIRACRGTGASLSPAELEAFDKEHAELLARTVPEQFTVLHWIDAHILAPR